jgi:hypothetical protein
MSTGGSDVQLTSEGCHMWVQPVFVCVVTLLGLLALFATPVIGAEWDDPSRNLKTPRPEPVGVIITALVWTVRGRRR